MRRRELLTGIIASSALFLVDGCTTTRLPTPTPKPSPAEAVKPPEYFKKRAVAEIHALPSSNIKVALESRIVPLLEAKLPFTLNFSGVEITMNNMTVEEAYISGRETKVNGIYNGRQTTSVVYHPTNDFATKIPGIGIIRASEQSQIPPEKKLPDGTWFLGFNGTPEGFIDKTIHPHISVTVVWNGNPDRAVVLQPLRTYGYIKEACSFLLDILRMEVTIEKMKQLGLPTNVDAKDPNGNIENISIIPEAFAGISTQKGRSLALLDIAGYLLALKVLSSTPGYQIMLDSGAIDQSMVPLIEKANLGTTEQDIFLKSYEWALNTPEAQIFPHRGDINKLP